MSGNSSDSETVVGVRARVQELESAWQNMGVRAGTAGLNAVSSATRALIEDSLAHGYSKLAELASIVEVMLQPVANGEEAVTDEFREIVRDYIRALRRMAEQEPAAPAGARTDAAEAAEAVLSEQAASNEILIVEPDAEAAADMAHQIAHFGYQVGTLGCFEELLSGLRQRRPEAIIINLEASTGGHSLSELTGHIRQVVGEGLPILALTDSGDVESRLQAARAGVDAYFLKPVDLHDLIDRLDEVTGTASDRRFQVVIIEDSLTQATYYSAILRRAGMDCEVVSDPHQLLDVLAEQDTDLILMDMYLPGCTGIELSRVIRQFPMYASIPIVFLSAETEIERQLDAMSVGGGDDFLTKPVDPAHLIRSVMIRAERARTLRSFMLTDNLTGLLNHTRIKEQLHNEAARAARKGGQLTFAMLDIDRFKAVNDTHGHHVGDRVIKTLARVLQQRLRRSDYIGRYGGEEFAVILPDASAEQAVRILDDIRSSFKKIRHFSPKGVFQVSFSGGVSQFPHAPDAMELSLRADQALYRAKREGRDRVVNAEQW